MKRSHKPVTVAGLKEERMQRKYELELSKVRFKQQKARMKEELDPDNLYRDLLGKTLLFVQSKMIGGVLESLKTWVKK